MGHRIFFNRVGRLGNNIIQYMAALLIQKVFGHEIVAYESTLQNPLKITDESPQWEIFCDLFLIGRTEIKGFPFEGRDLLLEGFFQRSDIYLENRQYLLSKFTAESKDRLNYHISVSDLVKAQGADTKGSCVVHFRLDDFQQSDTYSRILHPSFFTDLLRKELIPLHIVCQAPTKVEEKMYLAIFDEFSPTLHHGSVLEDFATLRDAETLIASNSTFAWTAAFLGHQKRTLPQMDDMPPQTLLAIEATDTVLPCRFVNLHEFSIGDSVQLFAGEDFQSLCDCTVLTREKYEYHQFLTDYVPKERLLFLDDSWSTHRDAARVFAYTDDLDEAIKKACDYFSGPRLFMIHNGDTEISFKEISPLLEKFPSVQVFLQNNTIDHPRIRSLPMGVQNKMWRPFNPNIPYTPSYDLANKTICVLSSHFGASHPIRKQIVHEVSSMNKDGLCILSRCSFSDYIEKTEKAIFSICPRGNAQDTHRLWETLYSHAIPVVIDGPFIRQLIKTLHLPLCIVELGAIEEGITQYEKKLGTKIECPVYLHLQFWRLLFETY